MELEKPVLVGRLGPVIVLFAKEAEAGAVEELSILVNDADVIGAVVDGTRLFTSRVVINDEVTFQTAQVPLSAQATDVNLASRIARFATSSGAYVVVACFGILFDAASHRTPLIKPDSGHLLRT